eukprot:COSAG05_NODE_2062_length_3622_cov_2.109282_2_plen_558_part_00
MAQDDPPPIMKETAGGAEPEPEADKTESCEHIRLAGNELFKQKQWRDAALQYTRAVERFDSGVEEPAISGVTSCLLNRAACYVKLERFGSAVKDCTRVLEVDPQNVKAWYRRGESRYQMKMVDDARDDLAQAVQLAPKDRQVRSLYEKAKKAAGEGSNQKYWMQNFDFSSGMFKQTAPSALSPGERFFRAASASNMEQLRALAALGTECDVNALVNGYTALMSAASKGLAEVLRALVAMPAVDLHARTADGSSALHLAAADGHLEAVKVLAAALTVDAEKHAGAKSGGGLGVGALNERGINALMVAAFSGWLEVAQFLVAPARIGAGHPGLPADATDAEGMTALHHAAVAGQAAVVDFFQSLPTGPELVKMKTTQHGQHALHKAAMGRERGHVECVRLLAGIEANQLLPAEPDHDSMTVLLLACAHGSLPVVVQLAKTVEVDLHEHSGSGQNGVHMAAMMGHLEVLTYLLNEGGLDPNTADNRGWTALHFAASQARALVIHYLVQTVRCDIFAEDMEGQDAVAVAKAGGYSDIEEWLLERAEQRAKPSVIGHHVNNN